MTLRQQVLHGVSWNFTSRLGSPGRFSVVLARLLSPKEFGVIGMLLVFTGFAQALADGGLSSALIYRQDATEIHQSTVFWMQVAAGAFLSLLFYCAAPAIAAFYEIPLLEPLSRLTAWTFIVQALGLVQSALLMKQFRFKAVAAATLGSTALSGVVAILLANWGYGVWALAWQGLISISAMTELVTMHFTAARTLTDTTIAGASSEDERSAQISFDYELLRNLILQGNTGYEDDIFDGASRQDHIVTAGLGAKYLVNRNMNLYADYTHAERESNAIGSDFADNVISAGIKFQY